MDSKKPTLTVLAGHGQKKRPCEHCGGEEHGGEYACSRITSITKYPDGVVDIYYREEDFLFEIDLGDDDDDDPDDAA